MMKCTSDLVVTYKVEGWGCGSVQVHTDCFINMSLNECTCVQAIVLFISTHKLFTYMTKLLLNYTLIMQVTDVIH